ncbi:MAG: indolepyruvate oxidoreductase subunit beta [Moorellaceae bacterium]
MVEVSVRARPERIENFVFASVGGQGGILAARILATCFLELGRQVKSAEIHGMAQRGGSVEIHVRQGNRVYSPLIPNSQADVLVGLEQLETLRSLHWLRPGGLVVCSTERILPTTVALEGQAYPETVREKLMEKCGALVWIDAVGIAKEAGNLRAASVALLGALSAFTEIQEKVWEEVISASVPQRFTEVNLAAFRLARSQTLEKLGDDLHG